MIEFITALFLWGIGTIIVWYVVSWPLGFIFSLLGIENPYHKARQVTKWIALVFIACYYVFLFCLFWRLGVFASWGVALNDLWTQLGIFFKVLFKGPTP